MYKIAILGCENSHANAFLNYVIKDKKYLDIEVVGVYSDYRDAALKLNEEYGVAVADKYDEFVGHVDAIMITARHGKEHYRFAKPYIKSGISMFIDKPVANDEREALEFMRELKENGVRICGGSSLIHDSAIRELKDAVQSNKYGRTLGGYFRAPVNMNNEYGNFLFYSQHLVQMIEEVFGYCPNSVLARAVKEGVNITVKYDDFNVCADFVDGNYVYFASLSAEKEVVCRNIEFSDEWYAREFGEFYELLRGGEQRVPYARFMSPMCLIDAIRRSLNSGKEEKITQIGEI